MKNVWIVVAILALTCAIFSFFTFRYLDIILALAAIGFAVEHLAVSHRRYPALSVIFVSFVVLLASVFQLIVRINELGYFPGLTG